MTEREAAILRLLAWCLKHQLISGVDPRVPFAGEWRRGIRPDERPQPHVAVQPRPPTLTKKRICECGTCWTCLDNARWERIYREKFADPDYYTTLALRSRSPFADLL
jgi:hypothetical protein